MFTKNLKDEFSKDLLNTVQNILDESKKCKKCEASKCECEDEEDEKEEMKEGKRGLWDNIHAKRKRIKAGSGERMRKPGSKGAPTAADFRAASESVEIEEVKNLTGLPKSTAEKNRQYIEITHLLGHKSRVPVHPTNAYRALNHYRNDPTTKSARIVSEEVEQIDEISKELTRNYFNKALDSGVRAASRQWRPGSASDANAAAAVAKKRAKGLGMAKDRLAKEEVESIDELSTKTLDSYRSKARKEIIDADANDDTDTYNKRTKGYTKASKKIQKNFVKGVDESFEQIDELSKATMGRYINKAKDSIDTNSWRQGYKEGSKMNPSGRLEKKLTKRHKGIETAVKKLTKEERDFIDALNTEMFEEIDINEDSRTPQEKVDHAIRNHNYDMMRTTSPAERAEKKEDHKAFLAAMKKKYPDVRIQEDVDLDEAVEVRHDRYMRSHGKKASGGGAWMFTHKNMGDAKGDDTFTAPSSAKNFTDAAKHAKAWAKSKGHRTVYVMEEVDLEESFLTPNAHSELKNMPKDAVKRHYDVYMSTAQSFKKNGSHALAAAAAGAANEIKRKYMSEEAEITEARGRPRKAAAKDYTIHPVTKEKLMHNNPEHMKRIAALQKTGTLEKPKVEAGQHIINQLRKASTSMTGGTVVHFTHGDSKHVAANHAKKALDKYADMKPSEKEDFQKKISHSHEQLMKHI